MTSQRVFGVVLYVFSACSALSESSLSGFLSSLAKQVVPRLLTIKIEQQSSLSWIFVCIFAGREYG
jgi:hypothetical protein